MKQVSNFIGSTIPVDNLEMVGGFYKIVRSNSSCYEKDHFSVRKETFKLKLL